MRLWTPTGVLFFVALGVLASACGSSPTIPSSRGVAGAWFADSTLAVATGGECVGPTLQAALTARDTFTTALRQDGSTLQATVASQGNGTLCAYAGDVSDGSVTLSLTSCQEDRVVSVACQTGELRDLRLTGGTIAATVNTQLGIGDGRDQSTWDVYVPGATTSAGTLTLSATFVWRYLGLPSSDYHVFTGTIFPGYDDGTISIPADPSPFCGPCGWFSRS